MRGRCVTTWVEAMTKTGSSIHAGNLHRRKHNGYYETIPVACHAGMARRFDENRRFLTLGGVSPLYCKDCARIIGREQT